MKLVAKCSASVSLSDQVHVKVCNPIPLSPIAFHPKFPSGFLHYTGWFVSSLLETFRTGFLTMRLIYLSCYRLFQRIWW